MFPRSQLATLSFVKILMCSNTKLGWPGYPYLGCKCQDLGNQEDTFPIWTPILAWVTAQSHNSHKLYSQLYVPPFWFCFLNFFPVDQLKFPIWTNHKICPSNWASPVTRLIWRGPYMGIFGRGEGGVQGAIDIGQGGKGYWQQVKKNPQSRIACT